MNLRSEPALVAINRRSAAAVLGFRPNCHPKPAGGCKCDVTEGEIVTEIEFDYNEDCKKPLEMVTADRKKAVNKEIEQKFGAFKRQIQFNSTETDPQPS
ncbi:unnamed protein product [Nippostrongylus brasiliensis]|uniref:Uncharacterized protein n=1 Tax=Nippostrongylus brasiliensis TaxID=27835 RepID=A0A0N4YWM8_NIPBR|nr:unnamed protein product [Nippostrongylus brasiliensis]